MQVTRFHHESVKKTSLADDGAVSLVANTIGYATRPTNIQTYKQSTDSNFKLVTGMSLQLWSKHTYYRFR